MKRVNFFSFTAMGGLEDIDPDILFKTDDDKTFQYQSELPSLPVPDLQHTLNRYLDSGDLFVLFELMLLHASQQWFSHVGTLPGLYQF